MNKGFFGLLAAGLGLFLGQVTFGQGQPLPPPCEPGFRIVEEIHYQEVCHDVCKIVPEVKKKWVYSWKDDPFCLHQGSHKSCSAEGCPHGSCLGPFPRKQLVKKEVIDKVVSKCVVVKVVELVLYKVYRKVPCTGPGGE